MTKGFNTSLVDFKNEIINTINQSNMPVTVVAMVVEAILMDVKNQEKAILESEAANYVAEQQSEMQRIHEEVNNNIPEEVQREVEEINENGGV